MHATATSANRDGNTPAVRLPAAVGGTCAQARILRCRTLKKLSVGCTRQIGDSRNAACAARIILAMARATQILLLYRRIFDFSYSANRSARE